MNKKFFVELYFYKDNSKQKGLSEQPNLDDYKSETIMTSVVSSNWNYAKEQILKKFPETAYIHFHESRNLDY